MKKNQFEILRNINKIKSEDIYNFVNKYKEDDYNETDLEQIEEDELPKKENLKEIKFVNDVECIFDNMIYIKKLKYRQPQSHWL